MSHSAARTVRTAVRGFLDSVVADTLVVACSGGADSLALAAATTHVAARRGWPVQGFVVDHGLQEGSGEVASRAGEQLAALGCDEVRVLRVEVGDRGGLEAAARRARYAVLEQERPESSLVLLGHTLDDQAETVLLGLGRGSGPRSIAGMSPLNPPWARPLLGITRDTTSAACTELGLVPWNDPHNSDPRFTRARLRGEVLPLLDDVLQGGVRPALARTARQVREDSQALDELAGRTRLAAEHDGGLDVGELTDAHPAVRRRVLRGWLIDQGVTEVSDAHLRSADALIGNWRGQGAHALPGGFELRRAHGRLLVEWRGAAGTGWASIGE